MLKDLYGGQIMNLYTHSILCHAPEFFEKHDFASSSSEKGEGVVRVVKKIVKYYSSRNKELTPYQVLCKFYFQKIVNKEKSSGSKQRKKKISKLYQQLIMKEVKWVKFYQDHKDKCEQLLDMLKEIYNYQEKSEETREDWAWKRIKEGEVCIGIEFNTLSGSRGINAYRAQKEVITHE